MPSRSTHILPTIVIAQFFCTSLWFASNAVISDLTASFELDDSAMGFLTSAVQLGFIIGTLVFALYNIADRFSPSKVFFICALLGAIFNLGIIGSFNTYASILLCRFMTGFVLAGIYPVGMKIASDYFETGLGKSLGYLVGALVLGTALPHLLVEIRGSLNWVFVIVATSVLAILGGLSMLVLVPDGPFRKASQQVKFGSIKLLFKNVKLRKAAFGYFGHMWELYAFWAFVPVIIEFYATYHIIDSLNTPLISFLIIASGSLSCMVGGYLSTNYGAKKIAYGALLISGSCCLLVPIIFLFSNALIFLVFLFIWGIVVIPDSPLFSTLVAHNAPSELRGTALTIVNSIGFFTTILSIQLLNYLLSLSASPLIYMLLGIGPIVGILYLRKKSSI